MIKIAILHLKIDNPSIFPPRSGFSSRIYYLAKYSNNYNVESRIFTIGQNNMFNRYDKVEEKIVKGFRISLLRNKWIQKLDSFFYLFMGMTLSQYLMLYNKSIENEILKYKPDIIDCQHTIPMMNIGLKISSKLKIPLVITAHDTSTELVIEHLKYFKEKYKLPKFMVSLYKIIMNKETTFINKANALICTSDTQINLFEKMGINNNKIYVIPNGVLIKSDINTSFNDKKLLNINNYDQICVFIGSKGYFPNDLAVTDIKNILAPKLPNVLFLIIGKGRNKEKWKNVLILGEVENTLPYLQVADIALAPLRVGGGSIKMKVLEYLAAGKPIISTSIGAKGLPEDSLIIEDNIENYDKHITQLKNDLLLKQKLSEKAKETAKIYSWPLIAKQYKDSIKNVIESFEEEI